MVFRVYVQKKPGFDVEARQLARELQVILGVSRLSGLCVVNRYDIEGISRELFEQCVPTVFSEPQVDTASETMPAYPGTQMFAVEFLPGQFDQRADSAAECIQLISQGERPEVRSAKLYVLKGELTSTDINAIKHYVINPIEAREAALDTRDTLATDYPQPNAVEKLDGFLSMDAAARREFIAARGLAMDEADLQFCQSYFQSERRVPTITEIKMIDTYWSDHCRHTTFGTELVDVSIEDSAVAAAYERYQSMRHELGRDAEPVCLMDMATLGARYLKAKGKLVGLDESDEVNACTVKCKVDVNGHDEDWLYLFKNETHNHPTEIEPFGGAATCLGGAIRDPLSGRAYVYQAMRVTGAGDPTRPVAETLAGKLPQRKLVTTAAVGYSSYGNQIGLATGAVHELYHPGYVAKRMEIGAVVAATPASYVRREEPACGDVVVLLGGRTGRDGIGGATGSSKAHNAGSLEHCGAEVQKGNPPVERKIQRLFRRGEACRLIKRCNDFGAGGVSVAIGELADGLRINLDAIPKKYDGLDGTELAISESQERMAVALAASDVDEFLGYAREENLEATVIAQVTDDSRVRMEWRGETIVDVSREFLASNGAPKQQKVRVCAGGNYVLPDAWQCGSLAQRMNALVSNLNVCSNKGLSERFDSTIGAGTVLMPFGGTRQLTPAQAMVSKLPVRGETGTCSGMAWGFNPYLTSANQFLGSYVAVVESISRLVASGFRRADMYLTLQEYFEKLRDEPERWGKPVAAVLGALMAQVDFGVGAIGGKDSMSGSFESLDVPPTLVSFATAVGSVSRVVSPEFKEAGHRVVLLRSRTHDTSDVRAACAGMCAAMDATEHLVEAGAAQAISTPGYGGIAEALFKMCVGNGIGVSIDAACGLDADDLFAPAYGSFVVEFADDAALPAESDDLHVLVLGHTTDAYEFAACGEVLDMAKLQEVWESALEDVYPYRVSPDDEPDDECVGAAASADAAENGSAAASADAAENGSAAANVSVAASVSPAANDAIPTLSFAGKAPLTYEGSIARPHVIIPVFPGTNCEYDTARAFERAGAVPQVLVINNLSPDAVAESARQLVAAIKNSQIIMIPGGFSGGDEPDGSAKLIAAFFRAPEVTEAVRDLLFCRDGLMLGICNGFQALIKLGLVPFGDIVDAKPDAPTLTYNTIGRHQSRLVHTRVASNLSPWLSRCQVGDVHTLAISHGEGRFVASTAVLEQLAVGGQIATQYCDGQGKPSMDLSVNPNGSLWAIEGITSPDGRVLGKMGHTERFSAGLYKNVPQLGYEPLFESGVEYFL